MYFFSFLVVCNYAKFPAITDNDNTLLLTVQCPKLMPA